MFHDKKTTALMGGCFCFGMCDQSVLRAFSMVNRMWGVWAMVSAFAFFPPSIRWMERRLARAADRDG